MSVAHAAQTLTATDQFANSETVVIGGKTYTFQTTLTNVDGNVKIGADLAASLANLQAAINLGAGAGTAYAAAMTAGHAYATAVTATTLVAKSRVGGTIGNLIATTETATNASWGAATMAGGTGSVYDDLQDFVRRDMPAHLAQPLRDLVDPANLG